MELFACCSSTQDWSFRLHCFKHCCYLFAVCLLQFHTGLKLYASLLQALLLLVCCLPAAVPHRTEALCFTASSIAVTCLLFACCSSTQDWSFMLHCFKHCCYLFAVCLLEFHTGLTFYVSLLQALLLLVCCLPARVPHRTDVLCLIASSIAVAQPFAVCISLFQLELSFCLYSSLRQAIVSHSLLLFAFRCFT